MIVIQEYKQKLWLWKKRKNWKTENYPSSHNYQKQNFEYNECFIFIKEYFLNRIKQQLIYSRTHIVFHRISLLKYFNTFAKKKNLLKDYVYNCL